MEQMNWIYTSKRMKLDSYLTYACLVASVMSDSLWTHGLQPARLLCPWDFPGKNTEVGCHFLLHPYLTSYAKINSKRIKDLNLRAKFSRKQRRDFFNLGFGKGFFFFLKECAVFIVRHQTRRPGQLMFKKPKLSDHFQGMSFIGKIWSEVCRVCDLPLIGW